MSTQGTKVIDCLLERRKKKNIQALKNDGILKILERKSYDLWHFQVRMFVVL